MKIFVDKSKVELNCVLAAMPVVLAVLLFLIPRDSDKWYIILSIIPLYLIIAPIALLITYPKCDYAKVEPATLTMYSLFGKQRCCIHMERTVYYIQFSAPISQYHTQKYIAISNEPLEGLSRFSFSGARFLATYDRSRVIVLPDEPYDYQHRLPYDRKAWIQVK